MQRFCIHKSHISADAYNLINICIHFLQFVFYEYGQRQLQLASCISFAEFVHCLYIPKTCISSFNLFQFTLYTGFVQFVYKNIYESCIIFVYVLYSFCIIFSDQKSHFSCYFSKDLGEVFELMFSQSKNDKNLPFYKLSYHI